MWWLPASLRWSCPCRSLEGQILKGNSMACVACVVMSVSNSKVIRHEKLLLQQNLSYNRRDHVGQWGEMAKHVFWSHSEHGRKMSEKWEKWPPKWIKNGVLVPCSYLVKEEFARQVLATVCVTESRNRETLNVRMFLLLWIPSAFPPSLALVCWSLLHSWPVGTFTQIFHCRVFFGGFFTADFLHGSRGADFFLDCVVAGTDFGVWILSGGCFPAGPPPPHMLKQAPFVKLSF